MARYQIRYRLAAVEELQEAIDWYSRRDLAAGQRIRATIRARIVDLRAHPLIHAADPDGVRQALVKPFPYVIAYRVKGTVVEILAITHTSRQQGDWRNRLRDS